MTQAQKPSPQYGAVVMSTLAFFPVLQDPLTYQARAPRETVLATLDSWLLEKGLTGGLGLCNYARLLPKS